MTMIIPVYPDRNSSDLFLRILASFDLTAAEAIFDSFWD